MPTSFQFVLRALVLPLCAVSPGSHAQDGAVRALVDRAIVPAMAEHGVPGMAVALTVDGRAMFFNYGLASKADGRKVDQHTLFELGSVSKTFTAILALYAQETGKLSLGDHPGKYLAYLQGSDIDRASLLHLGTYTAGGLPQQFPDEITNDTMPAYFRQWRADAAPGTVRRYSNPSIGLLGHVSALALKSDFADAIERQVFPQVGMKESHVRVPAARMARYAWGYDRQDQPVRATPDVFDGPAYGVKSSSADMIAYVQMNLDPARVPGPMGRALAATQLGHYQLGEMVQGLGWEQYRGAVTLERLLAGNSPAMSGQANPAVAVASQAAPPDTWFNKTGATRGFGAYVAFVPTRKIGIVMLANRAWPAAARIKAAHAILTQLPQLSELSQLPQPAPPAQ